MLKLYDHPLSGHAHRARALMGLLGLEYQAVQVDMAQNEHKSQDFMKLNPFGQVPVLIDGDFIIRDSSAILTYIALKYDEDRIWLPDNPRLAAEIAAWLTTSTKELFDGPFKARLVKILNRPYDHQKAVQNARHILGQIFDPHLAKQDWLVGTHPTIADIANYSYIATAPEGDIDLTDFPNVVIWLRRLEQLPHFEPMPNAADILAA